MLRSNAFAVAAAAGRIPPGRRRGRGTSLIPRPAFWRNRYHVSPIPAPPLPPAPCAACRSCAHYVLSRFCSCRMRAVTASRCSISRFSLLIRAPCIYALGAGVSDILFAAPVRSALSGACMDEGGDSFLLKKSERHYSEDRDKITSIFRTPMPVQTVWTGRPKGALMQTASLRAAGTSHPLHLDGGVPAPRPRPTLRRFGYRERFRGSITTKGVGPLPLTPSQPCAGWMRGRASAPCTTTGGIAPCDPFAIRGGYDAMTTASWYHCEITPMSRSDGPLRCRVRSVPLWHVPAG